MKYRKNLHSLRVFKDGRVSCINFPLRKILYLYIKKNKDLFFFSFLIIVLIFCVIESYSVLNNLKKILSIFLLIFFIKFWSFSKKILSGKKEETEKGSLKKLKQKINSLLEIQAIRFIIGGIPGSSLGYIILYFYTPEDHTKILLLCLVFVIAFLVKESLSFPIHRNWTYKKIVNKKLSEELPFYFYATIIITAANTALIYLAVKKCGYNDVLSQFVLNLIFGILNFRETTKVFIKKTRSV